MITITRDWMRWNDFIGTAVLQALNESVPDMFGSINPTHHTSKISVELFDALPADAQLNVAYQCITNLSEVKRAYNARFEQCDYRRVGYATAFRDMLLRSASLRASRVCLVWEYVRSGFLTVGALRITGVQDSLGHVVQL
jgi:hypothetical protein